MHSLLGQVLPIPVAIVTIPLLIQGMGTERFGLLTIAWMIIGYLGLLDLGMGRAITKLVAEMPSRGEEKDVARLVRTGLGSLALMGIITGACMILLARWLTVDILNISSSMLAEASRTFFILGLSVPVVLLTAGVRGVLEAQQKFGLLNAIKTPTSIATFLLPLLVLQFTIDLSVITAVLVANKLVALGLYWYFCRQGLPPGNAATAPWTTHFRRLWGFGVWMSIINILGPILGYVDRFFIGALLTVTAVAYYATPFDAIIRVFVIPNALLAVVFPVFSALAASDMLRLIRLHQRAVRYLLILMSPISFVLIVFARPLLDLWVGADFAAQSTLVLQLLATGIPLSSISRVPMNVIQAVGRPKIPSILYLLELPAVVLGLYVLIPTHGISGVAMVWLGRMIFETVVLYGLMYRVLPESKPAGHTGQLQTAAWIVATVGSAWLLSVIPDLSVRIMAASAMIVFFGVISHQKLLDSFERNQIRKLASDVTFLWRRKSYQS